MPKSIPKVQRRTPLVSCTIRMLFPRHDIGEGQIHAVHTAPDRELSGACVLSVAYTSTRHGPNPDIRHSRPPAICRTDPQNAFAASPLILCKPSAPKSAARSPLCDMIVLLTCSQPSRKAKPTALSPISRSPPNGKGFWISHNRYSRQGFRSWFRPIPAAAAASLGRFSHSTS